MKVTHLDTLQDTTLAELIALADGFDPADVIIEYNGCGTHKFTVDACVPETPEAILAKMADGRRPGDAF